jgi:hypothetical protein
MTNYQTEIKVTVPLDIAQNYWNATKEKQLKIEEKNRFLSSIFKLI